MKYLRSALSEISKMKYYTNSNALKEWMTNLADIEDEIGPFDNHVPESKEVALFLFGDHFCTINGDYMVLHVNTVLWKRPDWGGSILEMMKKNTSVFLFNRDWYRVKYDETHSHFIFTHHRCPIMDAADTCLIVYDKQWEVCLTDMQKEAIRDLMEPIIFGHAMADRLIKARVIEEEEKARLIELTKNYEKDYKELCLGMERLVLNVKHQRDLWKDRFFFNGIYLEEGIPPYALCDFCKEDMRETFYDRSEVEALKWRPGKECCNSGCRGFGIYAFEDPNDIEALVL